MPSLPPARTPSPWTSSLPALYAAECDDFSPATRHRSRHSPPMRRPSPTLVPDRQPWIMFNDDPFEHEIASIMSKLPVLPPAHPARESAQRRAALILHHLRAPQVPSSPQMPLVGRHEQGVSGEVQYGRVAAAVAPVWSAAGEAQVYSGVSGRPASAVSRSASRAASRRVWRM